MKLASQLVAPVVLATALTTLSAAGPMGGETKPAEGFSFRQPPLNSLGVKSMVELRGKPVLIDFWGQR